MGTAVLTNQENCDDIPMPVVRLNRVTLLVGIVAGLLLQQPLFTTALFLILVPAVLFGQKRSLIFQLGTRLFANRLDREPREDKRLMRFNNSIALVLLGSTQVAFLFGATVAGWALSMMVAVAAGVALAGFCLGCFLFYQFKLNQRRLFMGR